MNKVLILLCSLVVASQGSGAYHFCGGSVISKDWIVTAAHCAYDQQASSVQVVAGTINYKKPGQTREVEKLIVHEEYAPYTTRNDIALIKLKTPLEFDELVAPVQLPELHQKVQTKAKAVVSGWGYPGYGSTVAPLELYKAEIQIADPDYCKEVMEGVDREIHPTNVCAYDPNERRGQCNGDSGGPLVVDGKLTGIVSWSIKDPYCASTKYPGVYTRVSEYIDWIKKNTI